MSKIERYGLSRRNYISIKNGYRRSYGGNQGWFPKENSIREYLLHEHGCGVIALADLFLYWALTLPNGKESLAAKYIEEKGSITQENYLLLVEEVRSQYAFIWGTAGTFAPQLVSAINEYAKDNQLAYRATLGMGLNQLTMLKEMQRMLQENQPIILMIGHSFPFTLSRFRKKGIFFYKQTKIIDPLMRNSMKPYAQYELARKQVFGHFVTVTGIRIDDKAELASQQIMLRITSWGVEYYISYHQLWQYMKALSVPYLNGIIKLS